MTLEPPSTSRLWRLAIRARPLRPASLYAQPGRRHQGVLRRLSGHARATDVVAGIRNTEPIADLKTTPGLESAGEELERVFLTLEDHYRDMCDIEFTIEQGKLWMLQTRVGKRTATAALRIAIEMVEEGLSPVRRP